MHPKDRKKALTRVFQAFRMATNQELEHLEKALQASLELMQPGVYIFNARITFLNGESVYQQGSVTLIR